jgi:hypothetical protein
VTRPRDVTDNAIPSGTSLAVELQLTCAVLTGDATMRRRAEYVLATLTEPMHRSPLAFGHLLAAADLAVHGATELAIAGTPGSGPFTTLARAAASVYVPALVTAGGEGSAVADLPLMQGREAPPGEAVAYVCRGYECRLPTRVGTELIAQMKDGG